MSYVVCIEGLPSSGKSTVTDELVRTFLSEGIPAEVIGIESSEMRQEARAYPLGHRKRIMLFWLMRLEQDERAQERMGKSKIILLDRFWDSTIVFDHYGHGVPLEFLEWVGKSIQTKPDLTLFFNAPLEVLEKRKDSKSLSDDNFAQRIRASYLEVAREKGRVEIDAS